MRRAFFASLLVSGCHADTVAATIATASGDAGSDSGGETLATGSSTSSTQSTTGVASLTTSSDGTDESGVGSSSGSSSADTGLESSSTGPVNDDPYAACAAALDHDACEAVEIETSEGFPDPICQWVDVYTVAAGEQCEAPSIAPRCVLFFGYLLGCGGFGSCGVDNKGQSFTRNLGEVVELLFYPSEHICGPMPEAPPDEPNWLDCSAPGEPVCSCICDSI